MVANFRGDRPTAYNPSQFADDMDEPPGSRLGLARRRIGDFFIFVTGAVPRFVGSSHERQRYITLGALMLLTAGLAVYTASALAAMGLGTSIGEMLPVGVFFAAFVLLIDRSIASYVAPLEEIDSHPPQEAAEPGGATAAGTTGDIAPSPAERDRDSGPESPGTSPPEDEGGDEEGDFDPGPDPAWPDHPGADQLKVARRPARALWVRVGIAVAASLLISEVLLLQIFASRIDQQLIINKAGNLNAAVAEISRSLDKEIDKLTKEITRAETVVKSRQKDYDRATREVNCQLTGSCKGYQAGRGDLYRAALVKQRHALKALDEAQGKLQAVHRRNDPKIDNLIATKQQRTGEAGDRVGKTDDLLDREGAFLDITLEHPEVLFWRVLLTLLLLGIDLAPVLFKRSLRTTVHDHYVRGIEAGRIDAVKASTISKIVHERESGKLEQLAAAYARAERKAWMRGLWEIKMLHIREGMRLEKQRVLAFYRLPGATRPVVTVPWPAPTMPQEYLEGGRPASPGLSALGSLQPEQPGGGVPLPLLMLGQRWYLTDVLNGDESQAGVYIGHDLRNPSRRIAAKVFPRKGVDGQGLLRSWKKEVRGMSLSNPHIGEIIDYGEDRHLGAVYLISPLYEPGSLNQHVRKQRRGLPLHWCVWVLDQVLAGLEAASMQGMIHLDIKPQNIVLDGASNIRIIDWGLSQFLRSGESVSAVLPAGTPWFASPEQLWVNPLKPSSLSDLYGVGALAYWLITGAAPLADKAYRQPASPGPGRRPGQTGDAAGSRQPIEDATREITGPQGKFLEARELIEAGIRPMRADLVVEGVPERLGRLIDRWLSYRAADRAPADHSPSAALKWARQSLAEILPDVTGLYVHMPQSRTKAPADKLVAGGGDTGQAYRKPLPEGHGEREPATPHITGANGSAAPESAAEG